MNAPLLEAFGVSKSFAGTLVKPWKRAPERLAVAGIDLQIGAGETLAIVGESGCGKTTLGRLLVGLLRPTGGEIRCDGIELGRYLGGRRGERRRDLQMVFQDPEASLNPRQRIGDAVAEPLGAYRIVPRSKRRDCAAALLESVGLPADTAGRYPHQLSGGQKQRVAIARALAPRPRLLVADEPVSALDASIRGQILNLLSGLQRSLGVTLVYVAHDLELVGAVADRVAVMYLGRVIESGPSFRLLERPSHPYTATLLAISERRAPGGSLRETLVDGGARSARESGAGCPLSARCRLARPECRTDRPVLEQVEQGHWVACHARLGDPRGPEEAASAELL